MTFPGESISVDSYVNVSGSPVGSIEAIQLRAGSSTFTSGDSVRLSSDLLYQYLDAGDAAVVSWVVEVLSGSGTFALAEGIGNTATSLGSRTVTGPVTLVVSSVAIDSGNVYADSDARLLLTCTSGSLEVQQVKLRVWPPEGVAGGWSSLYPSWGGEAPVSGRYVGRSVSVDPVTVAGAEAAWDATFDTAQTHAGEAWTVSPSTNTGNLTFQTLGDVQVDEDIFSGDAGGSLTLAMFAVAVARTEQAPSVDPGLGLVEGVDWIVPPNEVAWDTAVIIDPSSPDVAREWVNTSVVVVGSTTGTGSGPDYGAPSLSVAPYAGSDYPFVTLPVASWPDGSATVLPAGESLLSFPDVDQVLVAASFTWLTTNPDFPGGLHVELTADWVWSLGSGDPDGAFDRLGVLYTYPAYRVWSPTAVQVGIVRHFPRNDGRRATSPSRLGQQTSSQSGRGAGYQ